MSQLVEEADSQSLNDVKVEEGEIGIQRVTKSSHPSDLTEQLTPQKPKKVAPKGMSAVGKTMVYPREDTIFKSKESLPYDEVESLVWVDRPRQKRVEHTKMWFAHFLVGLFVGIVAFIMVIFEEVINDHVGEYTQHLITD